MTGTCRTRRTTLLHTRATEPHSATRKGEVPPLATARMDLENVMLRKRSQPAKAEDHQSPWASKLKLADPDSSVGVAGGQGVGESEGLRGPHTW